MKPFRALQCSAMRCVQRSRPLVTAVTAAPNRRADLILFGIGAFAGSLGALVGLGGAFVIIPILTGPIGMSAHSAIGTSMAAVLATSGGSVASYAAHHASNGGGRDEGNTIFNTGLPRMFGSIDVAAVICIASSAALCAPLGARCSKRMTDLFVRRAQSGLMLLAGASFSVRDMIMDKYSTSSAVCDVEPAPIGLGVGGAEVQLPPSRKMLSATEAVRLGSIGVLSGFTAGFFGVGGGAVVVPALAIAMGFDQKTALGTSLAAMFPTALSGAVVHFFQGTMLFRQAIPLSLGCVLGSFGGGQISSYIDDKYLKSIFSFTIFGLGVRALIRTF